MSRIRRFFCVVLIFLLASCASQSFEDVKSKEYGLVVYRIFSNYQNATIEVGTPYTRGRVGKFPDQDMADKRTRTYGALRKDKGDLKNNPDFYYHMFYARAGEYPLNLQASSEIKFGKYDLYMASLKGCVHIKGGAINYIGDYYWKIGETKGYDSFGSWFLGQRQYDTNIFFKDNSSDAKKFMSKYYPEYNVPFVSSMISQTNCELEQK